MYAKDNAQFCIIYLFNCKINYFFGKEKNLSENAILHIFQQHYMVIFPPFSICNHYYNAETTRLQFSETY